MEPTPLIIILDRDYCVCCNSEHSLKMVDKYGRQFSMFDNGAIDTRALEYIICNNCGKSFNIDWSEQDRLPRAMFSNLGLEFFLSQY